MIFSTLKKQKWMPGNIREADINHNIIYSWFNIAWDEEEKKELILTVHNN